MERGKHRTTFIAAGSNTTVYDAKGSLYSITVSPANGAVVLVADGDNLGATPNYNSPSSITGIRYAIGTFASAVPAHFQFGGVGFDEGLTVAATSNAAVTIEWEPA